MTPPPIFSSPPHPDSSGSILLEALTMAGAVSGSLLFAAAYCVFLRPLSLYSGGFTGIAQILCTIINEYLGIPLSDSPDWTGILFWLMNLPLFLLSYRVISHGFFYKTFLCVCIQSLALTVIPSPSSPVFADLLTSVIVGGVLSGFGVGITLACKGSGGGVDIVGICCAKKFPDFSVGKVSIAINLFIYLFGALRLDLATGIYSAIFSTVSGLVIDRVHFQNIKTCVTIISRKPEIQDLITRGIRRGVTVWCGQGGYTDTPTYIFMTVIAKNELPVLRRLVFASDPDAFLTIQNHLDVAGSFEKRF